MRVEFPQGLRRSIAIVANAPTDRQGKGENPGASRDEPDQERFRRLNPKHKRLIGPRSEL